MDETLAYDGYAPGRYSPVESGNIQMYANISDPPSAIAPSDNLTSDNPTTVYGLTNLSDTLWEHDPRIRQLANSGGGGYQPQWFTYGGLTKRVDEDCADGPLEGPQSYQPHDCNYDPGN
jgi:hypothetical protein